MKYGVEMTSCGHDIRAKIHEDLYRRSSIIKVLPQQCERL
jgi:hypothetical protein